MLYTVVITTSEVIMERSDKNVYSQVDKIHFHSLSQNIQKVGSDERRQYSQAYSPKDATLIVMNKQHARIAHDGHYISLQTLWSVQQELSVMVPRPVSRPVSPHPPFMESLFTGCWSHKLLNDLSERLPYEVQHWWVCFLLTTPWTNAGDFPLSTQQQLAARSGTEFTWSSPQLRNLAEWDWVQIFLQNNYGGECRHGRTTSFCPVLCFQASKHEEKVSFNSFNGPFGHQEAWCMNSSWVTSLIVIRNRGKFS